MQLDYGPRGQLGWHLVSHVLQSSVVVEDHALTAILGLATGLEQLLGDTSGRRCSLELARADRLLHQGVDEIVRTSVGICCHDL